MKRWLSLSVAIGSLGCMYPTAYIWNVIVPTLAGQWWEIPAMITLALVVIVHAVALVGGVIFFAASFEKQLS